MRYLFIGGPLDGQSVDLPTTADAHVYRGFTDEMNKFAYKRFMMGAAGLAVFAPEGWGHRQVICELIRNYPLPDTNPPNQ